jgi:hypothetical protein
MRNRLIEELKAAGFPQSPRHLDDQDQPLPFAPTLEEIIEACGPGIDCLERLGPYNWHAWNGHLEHKNKTGEGSTPFEAVARLWLALQEEVDLDSHSHIIPLR